MIEHYSTNGYIRVAGIRYDQDLKIMRGNVIPDWWRQKGHYLQKADIEDILASHPEALVIGTGYAGNMRVPEELRSELSDRGIRLITRKTPEATEVFNQLMKEGGEVAGAFHLTC